MGNDNSRIAAMSCWRRFLQHLGNNSQRIHWFFIFGVIIAQDSCVRDLFSFCFLDLNWHIRDKVFKSGLSKFLNGCLPQNLLNPILNTSIHYWIPILSFGTTTSTITEKSIWTVMVALLSIEFFVILNLEKCKKNVEHFVVYAGSILNSITSLYISNEEVLKEPENIASFPRIFGNLEVHKIARTF